MKKVLLGLIVFTILFCFISCSKVEIGAQTGATDSSEEMIDKVESDSQKKFLSAEELEAEISKQEVKVVSTKYLVQDKTYKALYPDMLQAIIENKSSDEIRDAVIAFVAWDENNLPVRVRARFDTNSTSATYVKECDYFEINLLPGRRFGSNYGMSIDSEQTNIKKFKAFLVSYDTFDGETWENPLYENWIEVYDGKKYTQ